MRAWLCVGLVVIGAALVRVRLLAMPLDRDEGEYAYVGQLLIDGVLPYAGAYSMKLPGIYAVYACLLKLFGQTPAGIRLGLAVVTSASTVLTFVLAHRLLGPWPGVAAAAMFATLTLSPSFLGIAAYAEHFAVLPGLAAIVVLLRAAPMGSAVGCVTAGILFGTAFLVKQHAVAFVAFAVVSLALSRAWRALAFTLAGALVPLAAVAGWFLLAGVFRELWFWTVTYASAYASLRSPLDGLAVLPGIVAIILPSCVAAIVLAAMGAVVAVSDRHVRHVARVLVPLLLTSLLSTVIGFYFRQQYFLLLVPALALSSAIAIHALWRRLARVFGEAPSVSVAVGVLVLVIAETLWAHRALLFTLTPDAGARAIYGGNPFPEAVAVGRYLNRRTAAEDRIVVMGSEPEVYFYAKRRAATRYIYMYPLFENQPYAATMQDELIRHVEATTPRFVVYVNVPTSWLLSPAAPRRVLDWFEAYRNARLEQVGLVDMLTPDLTLVYWDADARGRTPRSNLWLAVYRQRRSS